MLDEKNNLISVIYQILLHNFAIVFTVQSGIIVHHFIFHALFSQKLCYLPFWYIFFSCSEPTAAPDSWNINKIERQAHLGANHIQVPELISSNAALNREHCVTTLMVIFDEFIAQEDFFSREDSSWRRFIGAVSKLAAVAPPQHMQTDVVSTIRYR